MPDWDDIFSEKGKVFTDPHQDMERIAELFRERGVQKILDVGSGTGRHLVFFSKKGFQVYGFDSSPKGITIAKKWLEEENLIGSLKLHRMEKKFPYQDKFFDAIISIQAMHHNKIKDILVTVSEIERVLKTGGMIFITFPKFERISESEDWQLEEIEKGTYIPHAGQEKGLPHHFFTIEEIHDVFGSFNLLEIYDDRSKHKAILGVKK
ncbi:MAG: class I SAM-dependent methyltransferase [Promethearchaeota archaeon]|nr:MAG: class I SAM-dependent methyltransferase [Candidatus Lokiarchaeota archaeon]